MISLPELPCTHHLWFWPTYMVLANPIYMVVGSAYRDRSFSSALHLKLGAHTPTGAELRKLNDEYFEAVKKNLDIDNACEKLQDEVRPACHLTRLARYPYMRQYIRYNEYTRCVCVCDEQMFLGSDISRCTVIDGVLSICTSPWPSLIYMYVASFLGISICVVAVTSFSCMRPLTCHQCV